MVLRPFVYVLFVFFLVLSILLVGLLATTASALVTSLSNASALVCAPASIISFFLWVVVPVLSLIGCRIWLVVLVTPATPSLSFIELSPLCPSSTSLTLWVKHFELLTFKLAGYIDLGTGSRLLASVDKPLFNNSRLAINKSTKI